MNRRNARLVVLLALLAVAAVLAYGILRPFLRPVAFALVIGIGFYPLHAKIERLLHRKNVHALVSTIAVLLVFVVPAVFLVSAASKEIIHAAQLINDRAAGQGGLRPYLFQGFQKLTIWLENTSISKIPGWKQPSIRSRPEPVSFSSRSQALLWRVWLALSENPS